MFIKRITAVIMAVLMAVLALPVMGVSAEEADFTVVMTADKASVSCGNTVTFTMYVTDIKTEFGLVSVDIPFRFDDDVFEYIGKTVIYPSEWVNPEDFGYSAPKNGLLWLRALSDGDVTPDYGCKRDNAIGFKVTLKAKMDAALGDSVVTINGDGVFEVIIGTDADGQCTDVGGTGAPVTVTVTAFDKLMGDVNKDGYVDNLDAAFILKYDAGISDLTAEQLELGDINSDGYVDNLDAAVILKIDAGLA